MENKLSEENVQPLKGIKVLDFSTLLPGPYASYMLAEAGAEVIKIERPSGGDELRSSMPLWEGRSAKFTLLNRGKRSIVVDLKNSEERTALIPLLKEVDVVLDQFRPGVMDRLGLGYEVLKKLNPGIIYCSITGYAENSPDADKAGHDLNYVAESGVLSLSGDDNKAPVLPPIQIADLAGGTLPAVINILLALLQREKTGVGSRFNVSMAENALALAYAVAPVGIALGDWATPGSSALTGASARYQLYRTKDNRYLAVAPLEDRFWKIFAGAIQLDDSLKDDRNNPLRTRQEISTIIGAKDSSYWVELFKGQDACVGLVRTPREAVESDQFRYLFAPPRDGGRLPMMLTAVSKAFKCKELTDCPELGEANQEYLSVKRESRHQTP